MRILFITQELDEDSDVLGVTPVWVRTLAQRADFVHVLTLAAGRVSFPPNVAVHSLGKERGASRAAQLARFYAVAGGLALRRQIDVVFVHMVPHYAVLAAAVTRPLGLPLVLWYTSGGVTGRLKLAHRLVDRVVTASPESFRLPSTKVVVTGHGLDTTLFDQPLLDDTPDGGALRVFSVGRISRVKDPATLIRATALYKQRAPGQPIHVKLAGAPFYPDDHAYLGELHDLVTSLALDSDIELTGSIPNRRLPPEYGANDVVVNTSRTGSVDKAVLEGMACRRPVLTSNEAFRPIFGDLAGELTFPSGDADALAERLHALQARPRAEQAALGEALRQIAVRDHGLDQWADRTMAVLTSIRS
jgi:glycosyltransferase involved in cell wall biosynthesis